MPEVNTNNQVLVAFSPQELEDVADAVCFRFKALRDKNMKDFPSFIRVELERERDNLRDLFMGLGKLLHCSEERIKFCLERGAIRA